MRSYQLLELCVWWMDYHCLCLTSRNRILNFPFCPALKFLSDRFYVLGEVVIYIADSKLLLEGSHIHVRHPITEILVSLEHDIFALWCVHNLVCECVTSYAIPIVLKLGGGEEVLMPLSLIHISKRPSIPLRVLVVTPALQFPLRTEFTLRMFLSHHVTNMKC